MKRFYIDGLIRTLAMALLALLPTMTLADDEYSEALKQTEEEFQAVRTTVQETKKEFDDFVTKYQEYEDAVFSQDPEKGIELARRLFKLDKNQTDAAKEKLSQLREMFNTLDKNGIKSKLKAASEKLEFADKVMGEVDNVWQFSKKFDPANAKDNPTYGLRLIGELLTDGASKMESIPLVGQILGPWIKAYGEVAGDFANALDRLGKKIENFRGGSLCGQYGYKQDQQAAFEEENPGGEDCLTYFAYGGFPRLRGEAYEGNKKYFLFDPSNDRGYFSPLGTTDKVYNWHGLLLERRALDPDWLAGRSNSLKPEVERRASEYYKLFSGWRFKTGEGWQLIEELGLYEDAYFYGRLDEETFVANYILDKKHNAAIRKIMEEYEKYVLLAGTVFEITQDGKQVAQDVEVVATLDGSSHSTRTDSDGDWQLVMEARVGASIEQVYSKDGFEDARRTGKMHKKEITGLLVTLEKEAAEVTITGTVTVKESKDAAATPAEGATVSASSSGAASLGSATTGGNGSYALVVKAAEGVEIELSASKGKASGSASVTIASEAHSGVDITMVPVSDDADTVKWNINVTVNDANGKPLPGATVSGGPSAVTTGADGTAAVGPISVESMPFTVTLTASVEAVDGTTMSTSETVEYTGSSPSSATMTIGVETAEPVTIFGRVTDANNVGMGGAVVTAGTASATTGGDGSFTLGPIDMFVNTSIEVGASYSDGTDSYASSPKTVTYDGTNKNLSAVLVIDVESFQDVTFTGRVVDLDGKGLSGASVMCGSATATTDASGSYSVGPVNVKLGEAVTISATLTVDGEAVAGQTTVTPMKETATAPSITLDIVQEVTYQVSITGSVVDDEGNGVGGATVSAGGVTASTGGAGSYSLPSFEAVENDVVVISATSTDADGNSIAGQTSVTVTGEALSAADIVLSSAAGQTAMVTVSGRVRTSDGHPIMGANVSLAGVSTTTGGSGEFTLPAVELEIGQPVSVLASTYNDEGDPVSGSSSVTPSGPKASANISIKMDKPVDEDQDDDDEDIDDLISDLEDGDGIDVAATMSQFRMVVADLDGLAADFYDDCDHVAQLIREQQEEVCQSSSASYALSSANSTLSIYSGTLSGLFGIYADLSAAAASDPTAVNMGSVDAAFDRVVDRENAMEARLNSVRAEYRSYKCDEDEAETDADQYADDEQDADDAEGGLADGGGQEVCGDDIDNDGDGEIDECDAGCCDKNVQVTVSDCGNLADDVFLVLVDGATVGVTPKGAANVFNMELEPGNHTITVRCLDDGADPRGSDPLNPGTVCVTAVVVGTDAGLGGGLVEVPYGTEKHFTITVPEGPAQGAPIYFDRSSFRGLEGN